jgi:coproporphyrinogen III oxidase-like Fe-S oxidoreductase
VPPTALKIHIEAVLKEWTLYCKILGEKPTIKEIHLGGGTPHFFYKKFRGFNKWHLCSC